MARTSSDPANAPRSTPGEARPTEPRGSINLRIEGRTRTLIDAAAAALGKTRTEFMVESARYAAMDVLLDQRLFTLQPAAHDAFRAALDAPAAHGPRLQALMARVPAWEA